MTTTDIETRHGSALSIREDQTDWTQQQVAALRHLGAEAATEGDLQVFFHQSQRTGLDPFARQIYLVGRDTWDPRTRTSTTKYTIQTGIDGFRLIARRASDAAREPFGYEDTLWCGQDGVWTDVWLSPEPPAAAKVTVIRNDQRFPAIATFREYAGTKKDGSLTKMWAEKGALMIAKCAEALALRKAFPQDLSGIYTADEMGQADNTTGRPAPSARPRTERPMTAQQIMQQHDQQQPDSVSHEAVNLLWRRVCDAHPGIDQASRMAWISGEIGRDITRLRDLTEDDITVVGAALAALAALDTAVDAEIVDETTGEVEIR